MKSSSSNEKKKKVIPGKFQIHLTVLLLSEAHSLLAIPSDQKSTQTPFPAYQAVYIASYSCPTHQSVWHPPHVAQ
jgi:hypothetical protein